MKKHQLILRAAIVLTAAHSSIAAQNLLQTPRLSLTQEQRIDGVAEDLVSIDWVVVFRDGRVAVAQDDDKRVIFYDPAGKRIASYGRGGQGPGEFLSLTAGGLKNDTLWVFDARGRRVIFVSPTGALAGEVAMPLLQPGAAGAWQYFAGTTAPDAAAAYSGGVFLATKSPTRGVAPPPPFKQDGRYWIRFRSDGTIERVIGESFDGALFISSSVPGVYSATTRKPFLSEPVDTISFDGQRRLAVRPDVTGPNANSYSLTVLGALGDTIVKRRHPFEPIPLSRARLDSAYQKMEMAGTRRHHPQHIAAIRAQRTDTPVLPPTYEAFLGVDYSIWLRVRTPVGQDRAFIVFDQQGNPVGHLRVPASMAIVAASLEKLWAVEENADDVESLVRYSISGRSGR